MITIKAIPPATDIPIMEPVPSPPPLLSVELDVGAEEALDAELWGSVLVSVTVTGSPAALVVVIGVKLVGGGEVILVWLVVTIGCVEVFEGGTEVEVLVDDMLVDEVEVSLVVEAMIDADVAIADVEADVVVAVVAVSVNGGV